MLPLPSSEPPTYVSLSAARAALDEYLKDASSLADGITAMKDSLAQIVAERQAVINELRREQHLVQETIAHTQAYLSPTRRLSSELLSEMFLWCFDGHPCCGWVLSAVCAKWRRQALNIPLIWSKIRLLTNQSSSPDTIRLWLERSGPTIPLDIEIYLRVESCETGQHPPNLHWGHIAMYYLVQQMRRWERFIFRFDKGFESIAALNFITGSAPLLKEFEVSSASAASYPTELSWFPSSNRSPACTNPFPKLQTLTLQYMPFRPTAPVFLQQLHTLNICALPGSVIPLDRILGIINANKSTLKSLRLHFFYVSHAILPLPASTTLEHLEDLYVGGHHLLSQLVGTLTIPQLRVLSLDLHAPREPIEETISRLYTRSQNPLLKSLAVSYGKPSPSSFDGYVAEGTGVSWAFLGIIGETLEVLKVGGAALESLIGTLAAPDGSGPIPGGQGQPTPVWACRRRCHMHAHAERDGASMLVKMVDVRNPEGGGSGPGGTGAVARLMRIELDGCGL
ncbi:hypothetical protein B0H13DRAFT_1706905 [Mycena leptocephala]|nr:hypothetical protein B0H13DRAFT_1706905 [Mycena leptocephala]